MLLNVAWGFTVICSKSIFNLWKTTAAPTPSTQKRCKTKGQDLLLGLPDGRISCPLLLLPLPALYRREAQQSRAGIREDGRRTLPGCCSSGVWVCSVVEMNREVSREDVQPAVMEPSSPCHSLTDCFCVLLGYNPRLMDEFRCLVPCLLMYKVFMYTSDSKKAMVVSHSSSWYCNSQPGLLIALWHRLLV